MNEEARKNGSHSLHGVRPKCKRGKGKLFDASRPTKEGKKKMIDDM